MHSAAPLLLYDPSGHGVHCRDPGPLNVPALHGVHSDV